MQYIDNAGQGWIKCTKCLQQMRKKINTQEEGMVLSADSKARLKWTHQLHELFVDAVSQMGGPEKATPKSVMRVMGVPGLTLYHLKSHLQKYRLAKTRDVTVNNKRQESADVLTSKCRLVEDETVDGISHPQFNGSMLRMQLEVQKRLEEHIEVQKHLQLRIEAQGKYLQSVLKKAQETLAIYSSNSSRFDEPLPDCSMDSCLTFSDRREIKSSDCSYDWSAESNKINPNNDMTDFKDQVTGIRMTKHREEIDLNK